MSKSLATSWRGLALSAVVGLGALAVGPAQAGRVITASDSGNGGASTATPQGNLFNCSSKNFGFDPLDPETGKFFSCAGAKDTAADFGVVQSLVNDRWSNWTFSDESSHVKSNFTTDPALAPGAIFFNVGLAGDLVLVLSGTWGQPGSNVVNSWSVYYLFKDVEIKPQTDSFPARGLFYNLEWTDPTVTYRTDGLKVTAISLYQINRVPEPGSLALVALALGGLALAGRRARRQRG